MLDNETIGQLNIQNLSVIHLFPKPQRPVQRPEESPQPASDPRNEVQSQSEPRVIWPSQFDPVLPMETPIEQLENAAKSMKIVSCFIFAIFLIQFLSIFSLLINHDLKFNGLIIFLFQFVNLFLATTPIEWGNNIVKYVEIPVDIIGVVVGIQGMRAAETREAGVVFRYFLGLLTLGLSWIAHSILQVMIQYRNSLIYLYSSNVPNTDNKDNLNNPATLAEADGLFGSMMLSILLTSFLWLFSFWRAAVFYNLVKTRPVVVQIPAIV